MIFSIIIPTYNEEEYLPNLLDSIKRQCFSDYEIIVADANSTDRTREIAEEYGCVVVEGGLPGIGRNRGAEVAKGDYLLFLDSDLELTEDYLRNVLYEFRMERLGIAITQMLPLSEKIEDKLFHDFANYFDTDYIERLSKKEKFKVLRSAKIGVSTRRLEEEGLETLIKQYGKSTVNDFLGKRTDAEELNYTFDHGKERDSTSRLSKLEDRADQINRIKGHYDNSIQRIQTTRRHLIGTTAKRDKKVVFYCVCGEGMGHAIRTSVIVDRIKDKYDVQIFSSDRAYNYLSSKFDNVYKIGGFNTVYINNKVNNLKTLANALKRNPKNIRAGYEILYKKAKQLHPDVIVTDFEIYATSVSKLLNIPLISLDNIHMMTQTKIDYPKHHFMEMIKAKGVIKTYVVKPKIHILTSFFFPKIKSRKHAVIYPPVIREDILKLKPSKGDHIIVYQTSKESGRLVGKLKALKNEKFIIYGFNINKKDRNLTFKEFNEDEFYEDFASSKAVICNGGFTFISEAIYLKKPIFSIPASGNFEQTLNGFYVQKLGYGEYHEVMNASKIKRFLKRLPKNQKRLEKVKNYNNDGIIKELIYRIEKYTKK